MALGFVLAMLRSGQNQLMLLPLAGMEQGFNQPLWEKRRVGSHRNNMMRAMLLGPIQPGQNSGQRPRMIAKIIRNNRQQQILKPVWIPICIQDDTVHLRSKPVDHMLKQTFLLEQQAAFIAPSHAPGLPAGQNHSNRLGHDRPPLRLAA